MRVLLDTNVLIAALITRGVCSDLLEHCLRRHEPITLAPALARPYFAHSSRITHMEETMKTLRTSYALVGLLGLLIPSSSPDSAFAQATINSAQLRGTVQDASQAAVPRATVVATNEGTNVSERVTSDEEGRFIFNKLQPASYTIKVEAVGFKTAVKSGVVLRVAQQSDLDFSLEVGEITTTVEVKAVAPLLNSVSAALSTQVDNRYITNVPLLGREIAQLAFLAPGVTTVQGDPFSNSPTGFTGTNFNSNGQRSSTAEIRMDGSLASIPDGTGDGTSFFYPFSQPSPEIVQEFTVQNNSFSAEYGSNGGTVINVVTKSGSNEFNGSGYWFGRRPTFDARTFYANRDSLPKPEFAFDNYGGTIGGPIIKQKTFFFFDYDRVRDSSPGQPLRLTVPTPAQKRGDFSQNFNADGSLVQIFNPFEFTGEPNNPATPDIDESLNRKPFPGNIIPPELFDPVAANLIQFYPDPTSAGDPITGLNNFSKEVIGRYSSANWDIKIDHNFSERSRLAFRYSNARALAKGTSEYGNPGSTGINDGKNGFHNATLEHT